MCRRHNGTTELAVNPHRLPRTVLPLRYELRLTPDLTKATFEGEIVITVDVNQPVSEIVLNAVPRTVERPEGLVIHSATVNNTDGSRFNGTVTTNAEHEQATIAVAGIIGKGRWQLQLAFSGVINDKLKGFYRSTVKDSAGGPDQYLACTQFEATDARLAFPCFDEPDMKAVFQTRLVVANDLQAISNMRAVCEKSLDNGMKEITFAPTFRMSTYLVAFVVGKLVGSEPVSVDGHEVRIWCVPGKEHLTSFASACAAFGLRYFKNYFRRSYCGDKVDLLAIPDFAAGAMENPGCITFREEALLVDPEKAPQSAIDRVADVVMHELAHLWFGDLVTMGWWNGLWLNEAFATWASLKAVHAWKKHWNVWAKFGRSRSQAMTTDALHSTRPIEYTVNHPDDAKAMFDVLTYEKGASVMRMLECFLGEDVFQNGIATYMERHAYGNTEGTDLWNALQEAALAAKVPEIGTKVRTVTDIMQEWVFTPGFPLVTVSDTTVSGRGIVLRQQPFKLLPDQTAGEQTWKIPLTLRARMSDGTTRLSKMLLDQKEETVHVGDGFAHVQVNVEGNSFVRVQYAPRLAAALTGALTELPVIERYNLLSDTWACVRAGKTPATEFLSIVTKFTAETDPNVWAIILGPLASIRAVLPKENRAAFEKVVRDLLQPLYERLGWKSTKEEILQTRELRGDVIVALGDTGNDEAVQNEARRLYEAWKTDRSSVDPNVIDAVVSLCAKGGDAVLYNEFLQYYRRAGNPQDEGRFLSSLSRFRDSNLLGQTLNHALDPNTIRTQDAPFTVAQVLGNAEGARAAWQFIKDNWDKLVALYPESGLVRMCESITNLDDAELEADVQAFFKKREVAGGKLALQQAMEMQRINVAFRRTQSPALAAAYAPPPTTTPAMTTDAAAPSGEGAEPVITIGTPAGDGAKLPPTAADGLKATV
ncbi:MAG: M1 family metallopeptidase [Candidatus Obscuribacterales bacterium]|nr:M1 family metallopeptidase [Candidatus Obscuribacterales bacterium]